MQSHIRDSDAEVGDGNSVDLAKRRIGIEGTVKDVIDFQVEQEDTVYPMVPAGAALDQMIRRPNPIAETGADV